MARRFKQAEFLNLVTLTPESPNPKPLGLGRGQNPPPTKLVAVLAIKARNTQHQVRVHMYACGTLVCNVYNFP